MTTLRSVPVRRIIINQNIANQGTTAVTSMFRSLAPAPAPLERTASNASASNNNNNSNAGGNTPKTSSLDQPGAAAGAVQPIIASGDDSSPEIVEEQTTQKQRSNSVQFQRQGSNSSNNNNNNTPSASPVRTQHQQQQSQTNVNVENFENLPAVRGVLNSPRSLKACQDLQIHPTELVARPLNDFLAHGVPRSVAVLRREHFEKQRLEKLKSVRDKRSSMAVVVVASSDENASEQTQTQQTQIKTTFSNRPRTTGATSNNVPPPPPPPPRNSSANTARVGGSRSATPNVVAPVAAAVQKRGVSPLVRSNTPLSRSATPNTAFGRNNTNNTNNNNNTSSPARDDCLRRAAEKNMHRQEIVNRARMEQETKDLLNAKKIAQDERQREVGMRKLLRDRLLEAERKRLDLQDKTARADRQRKLQDQEQERARKDSIARKEDRFRDPWQVAQAKTLYASPQQRRNFTRSASANSVNNNANSRSASGAI